MQEDVQHRSVTLAIKGAKLTGNLLKKAILKFLAARKRGLAFEAQEVSHGKQSVKKLIGQNQGVSNIEITDQNIKSFERVARKYGVDFALKKDRSGPIHTYLVFFKARDADVLSAAFKEFSAKKIKQHQRPSVLAQLRKMKSIGKDKTMDRAKNKAKEAAR